MCTLKSIFQANQAAIQGEYNKKYEMMGEITINHRNVIPHVSCDSNEALFSEYINVPSCHIMAE
jgi:hypothetical protein